MHCIYNYIGRNKLISNPKPKKRLSHNSLTHRYAYLREWILNDDKPISMYISLCMHVYVHVFKCISTDCMYNKLNEILLNLKKYFSNKSASYEG